jgi:tripartite-type tricarboxylate transporter receptor subunit TctC
MMIQAGHLLAAIVWWMACTASWAQPVSDTPYPTKPIRLLVASSPGGPNDIIARLIASPWSDLLGRPMVVDNRAGAAGVIATEIAARAVPDGYTLLVGFPGPLIINPLLSEQPPYDAERDFAPIALAVSAPFVLLVNPNVAARSMKELVALARARPGKLNYASGGTGQASHMAMELFRVVAGMDMVHVPYKGAGPAMTALLAAEADMLFAAIPAAIAQVRAQKLRAIAVGGTRRSPLMPDVPTIAESGYSFEAASWYGILAPRKTPEAIVTKLNSTLVAVLKSPAMQSRLNDIAFEVRGNTPREFESFIRAEKSVWAKVIAAAGMKSR